MGFWSLDRTQYVPRSARQRLLHGIVVSALLLAIMLGSAALCLLLGFRLASFLWIPPVAIIAGALTAVVQQAGITLSERQTVMEDPS